jgi:hypothetical protein
MSQSNQHTSQGKKAENQTPAATSSGSRFKKIETERYMWNPNKGCDQPLVGYLLNLMPMAPIQRGKDESGNPIMQHWDAYLIKVTEPTKVLDREKNIVIAAKGQEVLVPATHQLSQNFARAVAHPEKVFEVSIVAKKKIDLGKGQTMWIYDLGADSDHPLPRGQFGPAAMLGGTPAMQALPARSASTAETAGGSQSDQAEDEIPF